jgi:hypothetical protein
MRCYICDSAIAPDDVDYDTRYEGEKYGPFAPCMTCQLIIGESFEDPLEETEIDRLLDEEIRT